MEKPAIAGSPQRLSKPKTTAVEPLPPVAAAVAGFDWPSVFVWGAWVLLTLAAVHLIRNYGSEVPLWDDYLLFPQLTGAEPVTPQWLWAVHYNHRVPLSKLVLVGLGRLSHNNMHSGMYFDLLVLVVLSALFIRAARSIRGHTSYADASIPLLLLNYGHHKQFLWFWQVCYLLPLLLVGISFYVILRNEKLPSFRSTLLVCTCLLLLPLCGAMGLVFVPSLGLWLGLVGWGLWSRGGAGGKRLGLVVFGFVAATLLLTVFYHMNYREATSSSQSWEGKSALLVGTTTLKFLSTGLGHLPRAFFPASGLTVAGLLALGGVALLLAWYYHPESRLRTWGLFLFAGSEIVQALGVGYGRSGAGWEVDEALQSRYVTLAAFALLFLYFIWCLLPSPSVGGFFQMVLFTLLCALLPVNVRSALEDEGGLREAVARFDYDMEAGVPASFLTDRHWSWVYWLDNSQFRAERMTRALENLHDAGVAHFRNLKKDPEYREIALGVRPTRAEGISGDIGARGQVSGPAAFLEVVLDKPQFVYGIRLQVTYLDDVDVPVDSRLAWAGPGEEVGANADHQSSLSSQVPWDGTARPRAPRVLTLAFWINGALSGFRFYPSSRPTAMQVHAITLLVPARGEP